MYNILFIYPPADSRVHSPGSFFISCCLFKNQRQGRDQYFCTVFGLYCQPGQQNELQTKNLESVAKATFYGHTILQYKENYTFSFLKCSTVTTFT